MSRLRRKRNRKQQHLPAVVLPMNASAAAVGARRRLGAIIKSGNSWRDAHPRSGQTECAPHPPREEGTRPAVKRARPTGAAIEGIPHLRPKSHRPLSPLPRARRHVRSRYRPRGVARAHIIPLREGHGSRGGTLFFGYHNFFLHALYYPAWPSLVLPSLSRKKR